MQGFFFGFLVEPLKFKLLSTQTTFDNRCFLDNLNELIAGIIITIDTRRHLTIQRPLVLHHTLVISKPFPEQSLLITAIHGLILYKFTLLIFFIAAPKEF